MADEASHPEADQLRNFGLGRASVGQTEEIHLHLERCEACRRVVETAPDDTLSMLVRSAETPAGSLPPGESDFTVNLQASNEPDLEHPRYEIQEMLGKGGMGIVYKARHRMMERTVALKVLHGRLTEQPETAERFRREVKAAAGLNHPNIVTAFDADRAGDRHFLVMEYVEGVPLSQYVRRHGPLPVAQACEFIRQAALGLEHAAERGLVHRDIKPQNLMLTPEGRVKILDFGLARFGTEAPPVTGELTHPGTVMGSVDYLAPEQADNPHGADIRADIYSLGCTFYFLLTGEPPFAEGTTVHKLKAHALRPPPSVRKARPDAPAGVAGVVRRMLAKAPKDRYQSPADVVRALTPFAATPPCPRPGSRRGRAFAVAGAALLLLIGAVTYRVATDNGDIVIETDDPDVQVVVDKGGHLVTILDGKTNRKATLRTGEYTLSLNGDAEGLTVELPPTMVLKRGDKKVVTITRLPPGEVGRLRGHTGPVAELALSPDGKTLASASNDRTVRIWDVKAGKILRTLEGHAGEVTAVAFSPSGEVLATGGHDRKVKWWDVASGELLGSFETTHRVRTIVFAADGKSVLEGGERGDPTLVRVDLESGAGRVVHTFDKYHVRKLALNQNTLAVATWGDALVRLWDIDVETETATIKIANTTAEALAFDPKGRLLAEGGYGGHAALFEPSGKSKFAIEGHGPDGRPFGVYGVAFSPDGKLLVSVGGAWNRRDIPGEIKVWDTATGKELASLGSTLDCVYSVIVAADGHSCYTGHQDGTIRRWRLPKAPTNGSPK